MEIDKTFDVIGEFGLYQKKIYFLLCLLSFITSMQVFVSTFILASPAHRCAIPEWPNDTYAIQSEEHKSAINASIPASSDKLYVYDKCHIYGENEERKICHKWVYDTSVFQSTFVTEHDLVCGDEYKTSIASSVFFVGVFVGANGLGYVSDFIGRKKTLYLCIWLSMLSSFAEAASPSYLFICLARFAVGICTTGLYVTAFVLGMEMVGPSKRMWAGIVLNYFFAAGFVILTGLAFFIRNWMYLQIVISAPFVFFLFYWWLIPESPRWLMSKGRMAEAEQILKKIAKSNHVELKNNFLVNIEIDVTSTGRLRDLFNNRVLLTRTLIVIFNWTAVSMGYYGLSLSTGNLHGSFYINTFLSGLAEFPAYTMCLIFLNRIGRKRLHFTCMILGGLSCLSTIFVMHYGNKNLYPVSVTVAVLGKIGIAAAFAVIYVWAAELYPTVVRNSGMGISCACGDIGAMVSPVVADISKVVDGNVGRALPFVIFGALSILGGISSLWLPETLNHNLPDTIEEGKHFGRERPSPLISRKKFNTTNSEDSSV